MSTLQAYIFDLDGTLADTLPLWRAAEDALFAACGTSWEEAVQRQCLGMNANDLATRVHELLKPPVEVERCRTIMRQTLIDSYRAASDIAEIPGAVAMVRRLHGTLPLAVASGSPREGIEAAIAFLAISDCFDLVISSETVSRGKPYPDVFLAAASQLGVEPECCCVLEDSLVGTRAAIAAGMRCITRPRIDHEEIAALGARVVHSWDEVMP